jgi:hypothetical protein
VDTLVLCVMRSRITVELRAATGLMCLIVDNLCRVDSDDGKSQRLVLRCISSPLLRLLANPFYLPNCWDCISDSLRCISLLPWKVPVDCPSNRKI